MAASGITLSPRRGRRWDFVALGEVMLRLDPGEHRTVSARNFQCWEGGGEYNVARNLARCFGHDTTIVTALADNPVGRLVEDLIRQGGVDRSHLRWVSYDGVGRETRNGLYFAERGFGARGGVACMDRGHTAVSQLQPGMVDWERLFGEQGTRWFHTGGVFCALSGSTPRVALEAMQAARRHGASVSYDLNYRESLWRNAGGLERAIEVNRMMVPHADVLLGGTTALGFAPETLDAAGEGARRAIGRCASEFPHLKLIATTLRRQASTSFTDWGALAWANGAFHAAPLRENLPVLDRIGAGDAFAAGLIHSLLAGKDVAHGVACGAALGALAMATPGDAANATPAEIEAVMQQRAEALAR
ncbi:MAG TPA: sugar kinase [Verrucomicrobiae bacterium]|nr:sugar kinase [Verrucomicrobiae bacterium]